MGFLVYTLGTDTPKDGRRLPPLAAPPLYVEEHPKDTYGNALIVPCEFWPDTPSGPVAHLPAEGQPQ